MQQTALCRGRGAPAVGRSRWACPPTGPRRAALSVRAEAPRDGPASTVLAEPPPAKQAPPTPAPAPAPAKQYFPQPGDPQWPPKRPFAAIALDNAIDSVVDIGRHLGRLNAAEQLTAAAAAAQGQDELVPGDGGRMRLRAGTKPVVLVLGSGWGAHSLIKVVDTDMYDVVVVSPRNHFVFTPMLPSTAVGTVEFRSLLEPIRTSNPCVRYLEATCDSLDPIGKVAVCTSSFAYDDGRRPSFEVQYDKAVVAVGEQPATLGVPGVREHCFFMKEIGDAVELRKRIAQVFELASLPGTSEADKSAALNFVVVGGGPTGVEFAGTLSDFLREDLSKKYPVLVRKYARVTLLQGAGQILTQFDAGLAQRALDALTSSGVEVRTNVRVVEVAKTKVILKGGEELPFGVCLWSAGNAPRPLVSAIAGALPEQAGAAEASRIAPGSKLCVDAYLRVVGAADLMAMGDCSLVLGSRLPATAQVAGQQGAYLSHLINSGYNVGVGGYTEPPPWQAVRRNQLQDLTESSPVLQWLAEAMAGGQTRIRVAQEVSEALFSLDAPPWVADHSAALTRAAPLPPAGSSAAAVCSLAAVLEAAAAAGGAAPVDAARASQDCLASYAAEERAAREAADAAQVRYWERPFEFLSLGIMAYVGNDKALTQVEAFDVFNLKLFGSAAFVLWKSVYITKQVSFRNRVLILFDWIKARVFGRDISLF